MAMLPGSLPQPEAVRICHVPGHRWLTAMEELAAVAGKATEAAGQPPVQLNTTITRAHRSVVEGPCSRRHDAE